MLFKLEHNFKKQNKKGDVNNPCFHFCSYKELVNGGTNSNYLPSIQCKTSEHKGQTMEKLVESVGNMTFLIVSLIL